jgi:hypothetical protein
LPDFKAAGHNLLGLRVKAAQMISPVILGDETSGMEGDNYGHGKTYATGICLKLFKKRCGIFLILAAYGSESLHSAFAQT